MPAVPVRFKIRIDVQHDPGYFLPIRPLSIGVKQSEVGDQVLLIINSELVGHRRLIGDVGIERRVFA
jgi:hypothetical protein